MRPPDPPIGSNLVVANWDDGQPIPFGEEVILYVTRIVSKNFRVFRT